MRDQDTFGLQEIFQYSSLVKKPLDQCEIAKHWRLSKSRKAIQTRIQKLLNSKRRPSFKLVLSNSCLHFMMTSGCLQLETTESSSRGNPHKQSPAPSSTSFIFFSLGRLNSNNITLWNSQICSNHNEFFSFSKYEANANTKAIMKFSLQEWKRVLLLAILNPIWMPANPNFWDSS